MYHCSFVTVESVYVDYDIKFSLNVIAVMLYENNAIIVAIINADPFFPFTFF